MKCRIGLYELLQDLKRVPAVPASPGLEAYGAQLGIFFREVRDTGTIGEYLARTSGKGLPLAGAGCCSREDGVKVAGPDHHQVLHGCGRRQSHGVCCLKGCSCNVLIQKAEVLEKFQYVSSSPNERLRYPNVIPDYVRVVRTSFFLVWAYVIGCPSFRPSLVCLATRISRWSIRGRLQRDRVCSIWVVSRKRRVSG